MYNHFQFVEETSFQPDNHPQTCFKQQLVIFLHGVLRVRKMFIWELPRLQMIRNHKGCWLRPCVCVCVCVCVSRSVMSNSLQPHGLWFTRLLCPWASPGKNTGVGWHALLWGIFLTQGSNLGLPHCRQTLYHLSHQGCPSDLASHPNSIHRSLPLG